MGEGIEPVTEERELTALREQAGRIRMKTIAATAVVLMLLYLTF